MKKIILLIFSVLLLHANDFTFNPQTDNLDDLMQFCSQSRSSGVNFGYENKDRELCNKYADETMTYYNQKCNENEKEYCAKIAVIYNVGLGEIKQDDKKTLEFSEKACSLNDAFSCHISALVYSAEFYKASNDKAKARDFKKRAISYYKKACKLGDKRSCGREKRL